MVFTEIQVQDSFGWQDVDGQSAMPEGDTEAQFGLAFEVKLVFVDRDFEDALEARFSNELGI